MVERAIPPDIDSPAQERIAVEAAENGIRQTATLFGVAGAIVFAVLVALLYRPSPPAPIRQAPATEVLAAAGRLDAEEMAALRQAKEESEKQLADVTKERDTLQGKIIALERRAAEMDGRAQVAEHTAESRGARRMSKTAEPQDTRSMSKTAPPPTTTRVASNPGAPYRCGDGRTVRSPAACGRAGRTPAPTPAPEPEIPMSPPSAYYCGDGRTVPNPEACTPARVPRG